MFHPSYANSCLNAGVSPSNVQAIQLTNAYGQPVLSGLVAWTSSSPFGGANLSGANTLGNSFAFSGNNPGYNPGYNAPLSGAAVNQFGSPMSAFGIQSNMPASFSITSTGHLINNSTGTPTGRVVTPYGQIINTITGALEGQLIRTA